jgi:hypothetical protein
MTLGRRFGEGARRRAGALCGLALVGGALIAGCGGGGSNTTTTTTTHAAANRTATSSATIHAVSPQIAAVVNACRSDISSAPVLSSSEKSKLAALCQRAATGNAAGATAVAHQVCTEIIRHTIPSGAARSQALSACRTVGSSATGSSGTGATSSSGSSYVTAVLKTECQSAQQIASAMPAAFKNELESACQKVAKGDIVGAKSQLKALCESAVKALPSGSERSSVAALCNEL